MRGGSCCSPTVSLFSIRKTRLLVGIGRTFEPTRSGTGSFARSRHAHALGQGLPLIRALLKLLHHGSQARLRTCPDLLGDGGDGLLWSQVGKAGRPSTDRAAPVSTRMRRYASAATGVSSHTVHSDGNTDSVWFGMPRRATRVPPVFATRRLTCATNSPGARRPMLRPYCFCHPLNEVFSIWMVLPTFTMS